MEKNSPKYFLGTNSSEGFVSAFDKCYSLNAGWKAYIIKGGPGTGKSSFMKFLKTKAEEKQIKTEICPCSSDTNSLDAVIFPDIKTVVMDGTAPHIVEPKYVGVCEQILNFGDFWDTKVLEKYREKIIECTYKNKAFHKSASRYLAAAGELLIDNLKIATACTDNTKVNLLAEKLCQKYIPESKGESCEWIRFLGGVTPCGIADYSQTAVDTVNNTIVIEDEYGSVSGPVMEKIRCYALKKGYEVITVKNSFLPSVLIDHIIIPSLSLSFVRYGGYQKPICNVRKIHARRFINKTNLLKSRERIRFNNKVIDKILGFASISVANAKSIHDELEGYYIKAMDFGKLNDFAEGFARELF